MTNSEWIAIASIVATIAAAIVGGGVAYLMRSGQDRQRLDDHARRIGALEEEQAVLRQIDVRLARIEGKLGIRD